MTPNAAVITTAAATFLAQSARANAEDLLAESTTDGPDVADRSIARAQVWATLSVSYELSSRKA